MAMAAMSHRLQPSVTASQALRWVIDAVRDVSVEREGGRIDMIGWLDLHLVSAPTLIVTGCNDGSIPQTVPSDGLLTDSLRTMLGLACNDSRYARDAYFTEAMTQMRSNGGGDASGSGNVWFIAGRRSAEGDPLMPSRVLL